MYKLLAAAGFVILGAVIFRQRKQIIKVLRSQNEAIGDYLNLTSAQEWKKSSKADQEQVKRVLH